MVATGQKKHALGTFADLREADTALKALKDSGFSMDNVSVIARDVGRTGESIEGAELVDRVGDAKPETPSNVVADTVALGATAFTLIGLTSLVLPGIGPILAAGSFVAALAAATASTGVAAIASGNLVRALMELGIPDAEARVYSDRLQQGHALVVLEGTEDEIRQAEGILQASKVENWGVY